MLPPHCRTLHFSLLLFFGTALASAQPSETAAPEGPASYSTSPRSFGDYIDQLPAFLANRLPLFDSSKATHLYVQPHGGEVLRPGFVHVPFGFRSEVNDNLSLNAELLGFVGHGLGAGDRVGVSSLNLGAKLQHLLPQDPDRGTAFGFDYRTPLGRPPKGFSDGYRHLQPYVSMTRPILPSLRLMGFASFGANLLQRTDLPANFGRNQLHTNSLAFTAGVIRKWGRIQATFTARVASGLLVSDEHRQNLTLRPEVALPLRRKEDAGVQVMLVLGERTIWGPDGRVSSASTSVRFSFHSSRKAPTTAGSSNSPARSSP